MNIVNCLQQHLVHRPNSAAIIDRHQGADRVVTFAMLDEWSRSIADQLHKCGLRWGDTVLILHPIKAELYALLLALFRSDMTAMILDPSAGQKQIEECFSVKAPDAVVFATKATMLLPFTPGLQEIPCKLLMDGWLPGFTTITRQGGCSLCSSGDDEVPLLVKPDQIDDTPALITFTSGSTGRPKAIMRTQRFLAAQNESITRLTGAGPGDVQLISLPVFVLSNIARGATSVIPDTKLSKPGQVRASRVTQQIERWGVNQILASPAFIESLASKANQQHLGGVRTIFTGGGPIFASSLLKLKNTFVKAKICAVYGSTEAEPIAHIWANEIDDVELKSMSAGKGLLVGRPDSATEVAIIKPTIMKVLDQDQFDGLRCGTGIVGEIVVSGPHIVRSYMNDTHPASKLRVDGTVWHRTGDAGYLDSRGRLWLMGRASSKVSNLDGAPLYPFQVEGTVANLPGIRRSAVVAPGGTAILAVEADLHEREKLRPWLTVICRSYGIKSIVFMHRLPVDKRHNSKLDYKRLNDSVRFRESIIA